MRRLPSRAFASTCLLILAFAGTVAPLSAEQDPERGLPADSLNKKIDCDWQNIPLIDVINDIKAKSGIDNIVPAADVRDLVQATEGEGVTLQVKGVSVRTALKLILAPKKLTAVYKNGALTVVSVESVKAKTITRLYDIRDINYPIADFPGPRVDARPQDTHDEKFGKLKAITLPEESRAFPAAFDEILRNNTGGGPDEWAKSGWSLEEKNGMLTITTTKKVHAEIVRLLALLRQFK